MSADIQVLQERKIQGFCYGLERQKDKLRLQVLDKLTCNSADAQVAWQV